MKADLIQGTLETFTENIELFVFWLSSLIGLGYKFYRAEERLTSLEKSHEKEVDKLEKMIADSNIRQASMKNELSAQSEQIKAIRDNTDRILKHQQDTTSMFVDVLSRLKE